MKLISFSVDGYNSFGVISESKVFDLGKHSKFSSLKEFFTSGSLDLAKKLIESNQFDYEYSDIKLDVPFPELSNYYCVGKNYKGHLAEANIKLPDYPSTFIRTKSSIVADKENLVCPIVSKEFDYEGELAVIIGKEGRHIKEKDAWAHVAGYSIFMDGSIRDYQLKQSLNAGKNFNATGSFGPWIITSDEIKDPTQLVLTTKLNGIEVQHSSTGDLIFDIPYIISYFSKIFPLKTGDVIATGTPEGVGFTRVPPLWMKLGDKLEVEISNIGVLTNTVISERI